MKRMKAMRARHGRGMVADQEAAAPHRLAARKGIRRRLTPDAHFIRGDTPSGAGSPARRAAREQPMLKTYDYPKFAYRQSDEQRTGRPRRHRWW